MANSKKLKMRKQKPSISITEQTIMSHTEDIKITETTQGDMDNRPEQRLFLGSHIYDELKDGITSE